MAAGCKAPLATHKSIDWKDLSAAFLPAASEKIRLEIVECLGRIHVWVDGIYFLPFDVACTSYVAMAKTDTEYTTS